ncbi:MAG TPA: EAL domain-containing protein [Sulfuricurvum sp.]|nr:EAL domain-containing protein [Sulfuricurvum sp.]
MSSNNSSERYRLLQDTAKEIRVLYVEDDPLIRREYIAFLSRFFDEIDSETNGEAGLAVALSKRYDLIITDYQMPLLNGLEMIEKIKEKYPEQATLIVSAHKENDILYRSVELGIDGYLFKPIERVQTIDVLYKIVAKIVMEKENLNYKEHLEELVIEKSREVLLTYTTDRISGLFSFAMLENDLLEHHNNSLSLLKINNFKNVNDFYGYGVGNSILKQTADLLSRFIEDEAMPFHAIYRVSGAHFAILSPLDAKELYHYIHRIIQKFESTEIQINGQMMYLEMGAGIVDHGDDSPLSHADIALRQAEKDGDIVIYRNDTRSVQERSTKLQYQDLIKRALQEDRFVPYYQPIIDNKTKKIIKYEALARLILPDGEVISPGLFLPIAKETKMYNSITKMIIQKTLDNFRHSECSVSMNLSIDDIRDRPTREFLIEQIALFSQPERLVFELLESEGIGSYEEVQHFFSEIKHYGCKVAIDDFGSGYSNFEHLAKLNIDYIKIDGSLILGIEDTQISQVIVEMLSDFARKMGIKTIAEFVSKESISLKVNDMGIDESQGFLYGQAIPYNLLMNHNIQYAPEKEMA